jgi:hypothetical protein
MVLKTGHLEKQVLEKIGVADCMKSEVLHSVKEARNILHTIKTGKAIWIVNILGGNHL